MRDIALQIRLHRNYVVISFPQRVSRITEYYYRMRLLWFKSSVNKGLSFKTVTIYFNLNTVLPFATTQISSRQLPLHTNFSHTLCTFTHLFSFISILNTCCSIHSVTFTKFRSQKRLIHKFNKFKFRYKFSCTHSKVLA